MITGKKAPSHNPTRNLMAYSWGTVLTLEQQNVKTAHRTSMVDTRILGRIFVARMTAGSWPMTYPAVKTLLIYVNSLPPMFKASFMPDTYALLIFAWSRFLQK